MKKILLISLTIILSIIFTSNFWLPLIAKYLIINDKLEPSDVIVVPSGSDENLRIAYAAELYKQGFAPKMLLSGELALQKETGINLAKLYAISLGVPEKNIILEEKSVSTLENARACKEIIDKLGLKSIILVTYPVHTKRVKFIFRKILPKDIKIITSCDLQSFNINGWWKDECQSRSVFYEYLCFIWYFLFKK
ncbi:MAG: YdcF family protein [Candidatus Omnitrophota bacterium]